MSPRPRQTPNERDARRQALVEAARDRFASAGYHATTVSDIAQAAGVAKGTFYLYFDEKREVYYEVIRGLMQLVLDIGASLGDGPTTAGELVERARRAGGQLLALFREHRALVRLAYRESMGLDVELETMVRDFYRKVAAIVADTLRAAMARGLLRRADPHLVAYAYIGMVERVLLELSEQPADFADPDTAVDDLVALALDGLRR